MNSGRLEPAVREQSAALLNAVLATTIDLRQRAKHAHWNVRGPNFVGLHALFDTLSTQLDEFADMLAERVAALGFEAQGTLSQVLSHSRLSDTGAAPTSQAAWLLALISDLALLSAPTRDNIDVTTDIGDAATADVLTEVCRELDKLAWMLEASADGQRF